MRPVLPRRREIIVNGLRYYIGGHGPDDPSHWKGFGGRKYTVRFMDDGEILRTDDLMWDYGFKNRSRPDTAVIIDGWTATRTSPICGWMPAGEYHVFGPIR